jgi:hypothetical protein
MSSFLHLRAETDPVSGKLCFLVFRIPNDRQSPEAPVTLSTAITVGAVREQIIYKYVLWEIASSAVSIGTTQ